MKNPDLAARVFVRCRNGSRKASGDGADAGAHQADRIHVGLLAGVFLGALARLVALIQKFNLLQLLERLAEQGFGVFELDAKFVAERVRFSRRWIAALA